MLQVEARRKTLFLYRVHQNLELLRETRSSFFFTSSKSESWRLRSERYSSSGQDISWRCLHGYQRKLPEGAALQLDQSGSGTGQAARTRWCSDLLLKWGDEGSARRTVTDWRIRGDLNSHTSDYYYYSPVDHHCHDSAECLQSEDSSGSLELRLLQEILPAWTNSYVLLEFSWSLKSSIIIIIIMLFWGRREQAQRPPEAAGVARRFEVLKTLCRGSDPMVLLSILPSVFYSYWMCLLP